MRLQAEPEACYFRTRTESLKLGYILIPLFPVSTRLSLLLMNALLELFNFPQTSACIIVPQKKGPWRSPLMSSERCWPSLLGLFGQHPIIRKRFLSRANLDYLIVRGTYDYVWCNTEGTMSPYQLMASSRFTGGRGLGQLPNWVVEYVKKFQVCLTRLVLYSKVQLCWLPIKQDHALQWRV